MKGVFRLGIIVVLVLFCCAQASFAAPSSLSTGLIAWWPFNGNGADATGHGYDLNLVGNPTFAPGRFGQAISLNGTGDQYAVRPGNDAAFNFGSGDFTVAIWAYFNQHLDEQTLIEKWTGDGGPGWTLTTPIDAYQLASDVYSGFGDYDPGHWHMYLAEKSGDTAYLYFDTTLIASAFARDLGTPSDPLLIGRRNAADGRIFGVDGMLDDAAIWDRALSDSEIALLYQNGVTSTPEPASLTLLIVGGMTGGALRRYWKRG